MGPDERNPLLNDVKQTLSTRKVVKLCIVLSMLALNIFGSEFYVYSRNEWLWNKEQRDFFPNESVSVGKSCGEVNHSDPTYGKHAKVQDATARWHMYMSVGSKSLSLFTTFIYTAYTDYYGRRFLFILTSFGMFINNASTALVIHFDANPVYLVVAEILYGLSGTMFGFHAAAYSLIADVTSPGAQRSTVIFLVATSIVLGKALGTLTAGFYIEYSGYFYPALTSAALLLLLFILSVSVIPETLSEEGRIIRPSFIFIIKRPFAFYTSRGFRQVRWSFLLLLFAFVLMDMTSSHRRQFETLYQLGRPFCWKPTQIAVFATAVSLGENVIGVGFIKLLHRYVTDVTISLLGTVTNAVSLTVESLATNSLLMYISTIPAVLNNVPAPLIRSEMSAMAPEKHQGALFASIFLVQSLCDIICGVTDPLIYAATLKVFKGFVFVLLACYCVITFILLSIFSCTSGGKNRPQNQIQEVEHLEDRSD